MPHSQKARFHTLAVLCAITVVGSATAASNDTRSYWVLWGSGARSWLVLGSQDLRNGFAVNLQYVKPDHWLSYGPNKAKLVFEGNVAFTRSLTIAPRAKTVSVGVLAMARYEYGAPKMTHFYWELGWGLQQASDSSSDLDSELNSTLVGGAGIIFQGTEGLHLGVRYLHASNAGTKGRNKGQNQLHLMLGFRL